LKKYGKLVSKYFKWRCKLCKRLLFLQSSEGVIAPDEAKVGNTFV
jgi:hypothetical protein